MKILFCGTPEFAVPTLRRLRAEGFSIGAVVTQPDRPKGRGLEPTASLVKQAAVELGLRVEQPEKLKGEAGRALLAKYDPEAVVIVGYGQIIPVDLLEIPRHGWINLHASLLPKYRGAAPVQWALIRGEAVTGVTTMRIDAGLDTGPILLQAKEPIGEDDTAPALAARLAERGAPLVVETLRGLAAGSIVPRQQDHARASKAPLLKKEDGRVEWSLAAREIYDRIRGLMPWPGAFTTFRGKNLHLWWAKPVEPPAGVVQAFTPGTLLVEKHALYVACGPSPRQEPGGSESGEERSGTWLRLEEVQPADRKRQRSVDFVNGLHVRTGDRME